MIRLAEVLSVQEKRGVNYDGCIWLGYTVKFGDCFMETIQMLKDVGAINFVEGIFSIRIGECVDIMDVISAVVNNVEIYITWFNILAAAEIEFHGSLSKLKNEV